MRPEDFLQLLRRRPFIPLRIYMKDGTTCEIRHPDRVFVLRSRIDIGMGAHPTTGVLSRIEQCPLAHVVRVEEFSLTEGPGEV